VKKAKFIYPEKSLIEKAKHYHSNAYTHPIIRQVFWNRFKTGFNLVRGRRYEQVVEFGSDFGFTLPALCLLGERVIGTDVENRFVFCRDITLLDIQKSHPNLELKAADVTQLSKTIAPNSSDLIVSYSVLEHVQEYKTAMEEINKCLKPGGIFLCELPRENWFYKLGRKVVGYYDAHPGYDYTAYREQLRSIFTEVKLKNSPFGIPLFKIGVYQKRADSDTQKSSVNKP